MSLMGEKVNHRWKIVGTDPDTFITNIWKCHRCGLHKSTARFLRPSGILSGEETEYTSEAGQVIIRGRQNKMHVPTCSPDAYR